MQSFFFAEIRVHNGKQKAYRRNLQFTLLSQTIQPRCIKVPWPRNAEIQIGRGVVFSSALGFCASTRNSFPAGARF